MTGSETDEQDVVAVEEPEEDDGLPKCFGEMYREEDRRATCVPCEQFTVCYRLSSMNALIGINNTLAGLIQIAGAARAQQKKRIIGLDGLPTPPKAGGPRRQRRH